MKVIAIVPERYSHNKLIVEISPVEIAHFLGESYSSGEVEKRLVPGSEIEIKPIFEAAMQHIAATSRVKNCIAELAKAQEELKATFELMPKRTEPTK